jgi:hypothetical protein
MSTTHPSADAHDEAGRYAIRIKEHLDNRWVGWSARCKTLTPISLVIERNKHMPTNRRVATIVGILFIVATVTAIVGLLCYQPILTGDYLRIGAEHKNQIVLGALMELLLVCSAIGTAIGLFPILRPYGERIALGHLCFRFLEAIVITIGIVAVLSLLTLSQAFVAAGGSDPAAFRASGTLLLAAHSWSFVLGPLFLLGINTLMYSYLFYRSRLVPRPLAVLGLAGATLVFGNALLVLFGVFAQLSVPAVLLAMPIAAYEMILAVWLIVKGFNPAAITPKPSLIATSELLSAA